METTIKAHIYDITHFVDLGEIESQLNQEGTYEGDDNYEIDMKEGYEYTLKSYLLRKVFEEDDLPDNFLELVDDMKYEEINSTEFFKTYKVKIDEPKWDDWDDTRKQKLRKKKLDKIQDKMIR